MADPPSFLQWLHQTYNNAWKGAVDTTTVPAEDHAPKNSHWISTITASGAVVKKEGKNHSLQVRTAAGTRGQGNADFRGCRVLQMLTDWGRHMCAVACSVSGVPCVCSGAGRLKIPSKVALGPMHIVPSTGSAD